MIHQRKQAIDQPSCTDGTGLRELRPVLPKAVGDVSPDNGFSPSTIVLPGASRRPTAFVLMEPIAGASLAPSAEPILNRGRIDTEFVVDTTDSVGLPGLIGTEGGSSWTVGGRRRGAGRSRIPPELIDELDPLIVAKRRRRSSKGAPPTVKSLLETRERLYLSENRREVSLAEKRDPRNTVCGTTPSFCSSTGPVV